MLLQSSVSQIVGPNPQEGVQCNARGGTYEPGKRYTYAIFIDQKNSKSFPRPMAHRAAPISISIALGHASANAVKATVGGWSTGSSACLTSPLLSHFSSARRERQ